MRDNKGRFVPGAPGRPVGAANKVTREVREILKGIVETEAAALPDLLAKIQLTERIDVLIRLLPFVLLQLRAIDVEVTTPNIASTMTEREIVETARKILESRQDS